MKAFKNQENLTRLRDVSTKQPKQVVECSGSTITLVNKAAIGWKGTDRGKRGVPRTGLTALVCTMCYV